MVALHEPEHPPSTRALQMEEEMTPGSCELSAASLSASEMSGFVDHPQQQGEGDKKEGSDNTSCHLWGVLEQLVQCNNPLTSICQGT